MKRRKKRTWLEILVDMALDEEEIRMYSEVSDARRELDALRDKMGFSQREWDEIEALAAKRWSYELTLRRVALEARRYRKNSDSAQAALFIRSLRGK